MKRIPVIHLARVLRVLVLAVLVMNILCLLLVPGIVAYVSDGGPAALAQAAQAGAASLAECLAGAGGGDPLPHAGSLSGRLARGVDPAGHPRC